MHPIIHHEPASANGYCTQIPTPGLGEEEAAAEQEAFEARKVERFRDLTQDEGMTKTANEEEAGQAAWLSKVCGDVQ